MGRNLALCAAFLVGGCSTTSRTADEITETRIDPAGGIAKSADGLVQLELSKASLTETTTITIEVIRDDPRSALASPVYRFTPKGLAVNGAKLMLELSEATSKELTLADVSGDDPLALSSVEVSGKVLSATIDALSTYAAVVSTSYDPCADKKCGDSCSTCDPNDTDCIEEDVEKACDPKGTCVAKTPNMCGSYDPCAGKKCGDSCTICEPNDTDCTETGEAKGCNPDGECVGSFTPDQCGTYDPCAGKKCGDSCTECDPNDTDCIETDEEKACDKYDQCVALTTGLCEPYDPCAGKTCGDSCTACDPLDPDCAEDAVVKACDSIGKCVADTPNLCSAGCNPEAIPQCIEDLITQMEGEPVTNPPSSLTQYEYNGKCTYFRPQICCDIYSVLYDEQCNVICAPDGGITGTGDGKCTDFSSTAIKGQTIWADPRSYP